MSKEELIIALLKSKYSIAELFNNNLDNNKISDIKKILNRLRDILTREHRKEIRKNLCRKENKENLSELQKEEIDEYLTKLVRIHNKKEEYSHHDRDDPDYSGIRNIESLFIEVDKKDYYKPILVKSSFKGNYNYCESRGDRNNNLSVNLTVPLQDYATFTRYDK